MGESRRRGADLAVIISDQVYGDVAQFGQVGLTPAQFQRVEVDNSPGEPPDGGWMYLP